MCFCIMMNVLFLKLVLEAVSVQLYNFLQLYCDVAYNWFDLWTSSFCPFCPHKSGCVWTLMQYCLPILCLMVQCNIIDHFKVSMQFNES